MTIIATTQPAFALTPDNHVEHGHSRRGISSKDQTNFAAVNGINAAHHTTHDLSRQLGDLNSDALSAVYKSTYDSVVATNVQGEANKLATSVAGSELRVQAERNTALLAFNLEHASHAQLMLATTNQSATMLEMLKCCCKTDELIRAEAGATRELIRELNLADVRDKLHSAQTAIIIANSKMVGVPIVL